MRTLLAKLNTLLLCLLNKNIQIGTHTIFEFGTKIYLNNNHLHIGNNSYLRSKRKGYQGGMPYPTTILIDVNGAFVSIGNNTRINGAYIHSQKKITIGNNCVIASGVNIIDSNGHSFYSLNRTKGRDKPKEILIFDNVWIGLNAIILKGTTIGENCVIGAGSVVKGNYPSNSLIVGNPATVVKTFKIRQ